MDQHLKKTSKQLYNLPYPLPTPPPPYLHGYYYGYPPEVNHDMYYRMMMLSNAAYAADEQSRRILT
jgi:hypothetical protein